MRFNSSEECMKSELDIFTVPPTQSSIENGIWVNKEAENGFASDSGTVTFNIDALSDAYIDLSETYLSLKVSIRKKDVADNTKSTEFKEDDRIGPVNNFMHSMFSQVEVKFNSTSIENSNSFYPYRAYIENLLNYDEGLKKSFLQNELFYDDTAGSMEEFKLNETESKIDMTVPTAPVYIPPSNSCNKGYIARRQRFLKSKQVELVGKLHLNVATIPKYMLNNIAMQITLTRSDPKFSLCGNCDPNDSYLIFIHAANIRYRKLNINPSVAIGHAIGLEKVNAKYPLKDIKMNSASIAIGLQELTISNIHTGTIPNRLVMALVDSGAYSGDLKKNPFNFQHFGLEKLLINVGGVNIPYNETLVFDYSRLNYAAAYNTLFCGMGELSKNISYEDFAKGYALYAFNLTPDLCSLNHFNIQKQGGIYATLKFKNPPEINITALFYLEFDNVVEVTKNRVSILGS